MNAFTIIGITVISIVAVILAGKGALHYADVTFRWFAERNGF